MSKLRILFRNARALAKYPFRDYSCLCQLDGAKGLAVGKTYRSDKTCRTFLKYVSQSLKNETKNKLYNANVLPVPEEGTKDLSIIEQKEDMLVRS